jgi:hypothetical protein
MYELSAGSCLAIRMQDKIIVSKHLPTSSKMSQRNEERMKLCGSVNEINGRGDPLLWPRDTLYPQKLALSSPTSGGRSVGILRLRTTGHGFFCASATQCLVKFMNDFIFPFSPLPIRCYFSNVLRYRYLLPRPPYEFYKVQETFRRLD